MPEIAVEQHFELDPNQLAVITGVPTKQLQEGHEFSWSKARFKVGSIGDKCTIVRIGSTGLQEENTKDFTVNPSGFEEINFFDNPIPDPKERGFGLSQTIPKPLTIVPEPKQTESSGTMDSVEVFGPYLRQPHTPLRRNRPVINEPVNNMDLRSSLRTDEVRKALNHMLAFDRKESNKLDPKVEIAMIRLCLGIA